MVVGCGTAWPIWYVLLSDVFVRCPNGSYTDAMRLYLHTVFTAGQYPKQCKLLNEMFHVERMAWIVLLDSMLVPITHRPLGLATVLGAYDVSPLVRRCSLFDLLVDVIAGPMEI